MFYSPVKRVGGKGKNAKLLIPHFAKAEMYAEPCFGAGSVFYGLVEGIYPREVVNDLDASIVTFFRVLRDRPDELIKLCELTPYARDEYLACREKSDDPVEEARRVWVRLRQTFAGLGDGEGRWARAQPGGPYYPDVFKNSIERFRPAAERLRHVAIDHLDAKEFVKKWRQHGKVFFYVDPPYVLDTRSDKQVYEHEMTEAQHVSLAEELHAAVRSGCDVAISGYANDLYDLELFLGWRRLKFNVTASTARVKDETSRAEEILWMSYGPEKELGTFRGPPKPTNDKERELLEIARKRRMVK